MINIDIINFRCWPRIKISLVPGSVNLIKGPSGCGKSTLLSILGLLDSPSSGEYWLNEKSVAQLTFGARSRIRNREIGFIFQSFNLIGDLTVSENVELPLTYRGLPPRERKKRVQKALEREKKPSVTRLKGPASHALPDATLFVAKGWSARLHSSGAWLLQRA